MSETAPDVGADPRVGPPTEQHAQFAATADVNPRGEFEIVAITAGHANGWNFTAKALQESVKLWDGTNSLVDHAGFFDMPSIMKLGGVCYGPAWDETRQGIKATLRPFGPCGPLVADLGKEVLAAKAKGDPLPKIGFSADIWFKANGRDVIEITRVTSLDLVIDPARGGDFLRALNQSQEWRLNHMSDKPAPAPAAPSQTPATDQRNTQQAQLTRDAEALKIILDAQQQQAQMAHEVEAMRAIRLQACAHLLDTGLAASRLPAPSQAAVRKQFTGHVFEPTELTAAIDDARELVSQLTAGAIIHGPGRMSAMFDANDKLQAAVDDLFLVERDKPAQGLKVARLSGIRQLYHMLTGDLDFHGGYYPEHAQLAETSDFSGLVKNAMNKAVQEKWAELGRAGYTWWMQLLPSGKPEHFETLNQITWIITGTVGTLPSVAEGAEYTELVVGDSPEVSSFTKYGGYIPLTLELIDRDETRKLRAYPRELANGALRRISGLCAALFTDNAGIGPTLADTGALFNSTAVTTAGGHLNLLTTALAAAQWEIVGGAVYDQPMLVKNAAGYYGTGAAQAVDPRYLLVPRELRLTAMKIIYPTLENAANIYSENLQRGQPGDVITVPEWTDANDYAAVIDPNLVPGVMVGERFGIMPEIFVSGSELGGAVFTNDEHRLKVREFVAVGVADFRPLHKSNVA